MSLQRLCVYCGAAAGIRPAYSEAARSVGRLLGERHIELIYGGGHVGLMGALADAALAAGARVVGIIPQPLIDQELGHHGVSELRIVENMHARKHQMAQLAQAFLALPGGWGTLEELTEMLTWSQLGFHRKPIALLNVEGFFDPLLRFADHMHAEGFLRRHGRELLIHGTECGALLDRLSTLL